MTELKTCPGCASNEHLRRLEPRLRETQLRRFRLIGCERCGVAFFPSPPSESQLDAYYASSEGWESKYRMDRLASRIEAKRVQYRPKLEALRPYLPQEGRALDYGCGIGAFLDVLQEKGWETFGVEPAPGLSSFTAQRHTMVSSPPQDASFDLIVANHVLEHLHEPSVVLRSLAGATKQGGHLFISVPDLASLPVHGDVGYVASRQHIVSFTRSSLSAVLGLAGYSVAATPDWSPDRERGRLPILAKRVDEQREPDGAPLAEAEAALGAYAPRAREFERTHRRRQREVRRKRGRVFTPRKR